MTSIKGIAGAAAILIGLSGPSAQAGYIVDLTQEGSNVVASGSGAIDLTGLSFLNTGADYALVDPGVGEIVTGAAIFPTSEPLDRYAGFTGPTSFGSGSLTFANSGGGDIVGISPSVPVLFVPSGYASDSPLSDTATYDNQTFSSLAATPGTYKWTWGSGVNQNFTLVIGTAGVVPEPSTWAMLLLGFAGLGFMGYQTAGRRRRTARHA